LSELEFANWPFLVLLLAIPPAVAWYYRQQRRGRTPGLLLPSVAPVRALAVRPARRRWLPLVLRSLAVAALVLALARPRAGQADATVQAEGIDIMLSLDLSRSMLDRLRRQADDSNKLTVAKDVIDRFIAGRPNDRIGLVQFQSEAAVASPLTLDHEALRELLKSLENGRLPEGTAIGSGVATAVNALRESTARSRVVILLTDGENNAGEIEPIASARLAKALGIRLYTIGLANRLQGSSGPLAGIDERTMREMSGIADGEYFAAVDLESLDAVYQRIGELETSRVGAREFTAFNEYAPYFVIAALALLLVEQLLAYALVRRTP
jgi:Ca-activated chloride channel family protein